MSTGATGDPGPADGPDLRAAVIVGPGRVGTALALRLADAGYRVAGVVGRSAERLAAFAERFPEAAAGGLAEIAPRGGLVLVCVGDDELEGVLREAGAADAVTPGSRWVHVSGQHGLEVLRPVRAAGARGAALHPAQTFPDADTGHAALPGTAWAVTAEPADVGWARVLVTELRGSPFGVRDDMRTLYHAGLTVGSNATTGVVAMAGDLLRAAGVSDPGQVLAPLVEASTAGALERGAEALTGPVRRGDAGTVAAHLAELERDWPEAAAAYRALARLLLAQSRRAGLDPEAADRIAKVLGDEGRGG